MIYKLYDCVNGEWFSDKLYDEGEARSYLVNQVGTDLEGAFLDGDYYFAPAGADEDNPYDGDITELSDLV